MPENQAPILPPGVSWTESSGVVYDARGRQGFGAVYDVRNSTWRSKVILPSGTRSDFCLFLFAPCGVQNARHSYGYACAFRLAGHKNKIAKISPLMPEGSIES